MVPQDRRRVVIVGDIGPTTGAIEMLLSAAPRGNEVVVTIRDREPIPDLLLSDSPARLSEYLKAPRMTRAEAKRQNRATRRR